MLVGGFEMGCRQYCWGCWHVQVSIIRRSPKWLYRMYWCLVITNLADSHDRVCEVAGRSKGSEVHASPPALDATNEGEALGLQALYGAA